MLVFLGCTNRDNTQQGEVENLIRISGELEGGEEVLVTLDRIGAMAFEPLDSVRCDKKGRFSFTIPGEGMNFYKLKYTEIGYVTLIASPGEVLEVTGQPDTLYPYQVKGSEYSMQLMQLSERHQRILTSLNDIAEESAKTLGATGYAERKIELNRQYDSITLAFKEHSREFIYKNPESPALLVALYNVFGHGLPVFDLPDDLEVYRFVDSSLNVNYPENEAVRSLRTMVVATEAQLRNLDQEDPSIKVGMKAPDFVSWDHGGVPVALKDFRGNPVILQFWASWSKPSVEENSYLEAAFKRHRDQGLQILQVSLDEVPEAWKEAANLDYPGWVNVCEFKRWESQVVGLYSLERIPANFLIDETGTVVRKDIFGEELLESLENYLNKK